MRSPLSIESQRRAYEEDPKWRAKAVLRIAATLTALIAIALFAASISYTDSGFTSTAGPEGDWTDGLALAPVIFALLYNSAVLIGHFGLRRGRPFHPSIYLALDLITWALTLPAVVVAVAGGIFWYWSDPVPSAGGHIDCTVFFNAFAMQCNPIVYTIGRMEIVGAVFMVFLFVIHFALFAMDCIELHRRRQTAALALMRHEFDMQPVKDIERGSSSHSSGR